VSFVVKTLTWVCRVNLHLTISHGFPAVAPTDVRQAVAVAQVDALPAAAPVDGPQAQEAACTCYVPSAVAEPA
jgi:hypothetical protein